MFSLAIDVAFQVLRLDIQRCHCTFQLQLIELTFDSDFSLWVVKQLVHSLLFPEHFAENNSPIADHFLL